MHVRALRVRRQVFPPPADRGPHRVAEARSWIASPPSARPGLRSIYRYGRKDQWLHPLDLTSRSAVLQKVLQYPLQELLQKVLLKVLQKVLQKDVRTPINGKGTKGMILEYFESNPSNQQNESIPCRFLENAQDDWCTSKTERKT